MQPHVVPASAQDRPRAIAALVTAFVADPLIRWMFPDPHQYLQYFPRLLHYFGGRSFDHRSAYRSADFMAAALWLPSGITPDTEGLAGVIQEGTDASLTGEVFGLFGQVAGAHPAFAHWHLPVIGVDPGCKGKGYGSALLRHGLEVCDRAHIAAYLEATNPQNVPFYSRFGFEVVGRVQAGGSPLVTPMLRAAR